MQNTTNTHDHTERIEALKHLRVEDYEGFYAGLDVGHHEDDERTTVTAC